MKKPEHHFLHILNIGRYCILTPLPGQTLKGKPVTPGITVEGCEKYRKRFAEGSVFGTTTLSNAHRRSASFYKVEDLFFLGEEDPYTDIFNEPVRRVLIEEYEQFKLSKH